MEGSDSTKSSDGGDIGALAERLSRMEVLVSEIRTSADIQEVNNLWQAIANNRIENELAQTKLSKRLDAVDIEKLASFVSGAVMQQMEENIDQVKLQHNIQVEVLRTQLDVCVQKVDTKHQRELERLARVTRDLQAHLDLVQAYVDMAETQNEWCADQKTSFDKKKPQSQSDCIPQKLKERLHALMTRLGDNCMEGLEPELQQMSALLNSVKGEPAEISSAREVSPTKVYPMPQDLLPKRAFAAPGSAHVLPQGIMSSETIYAPGGLSPGASLVASPPSPEKSDRMVTDQLRHTWGCGGTVVVDRPSGHGGSLVVRQSSGQVRTSSISVPRQDTPGTSVKVMPCPVGSLLPKCSLSPSPSPRATYAEIPRPPSVDTPRLARSSAGHHVDSTRQTSGRLRC